MIPHATTLPMTRRRAVSILCATVAASQLRISAAEPADYAADVEFLLSELEQKAGHFFALKGIDWNAVRTQFREEAKGVKDDVAHLKMCNRLVARLHDGHAGLMDLKVQIPDESKGRRFTGPRVHLVAVGEKVFVRQAFASAADAGVKQGMEVTAIDGVPVRKWLDQAVTRLSEERGYSTSQMALYYACHAGLADWEGTKITLELLEGATPKNVTLTRSGGPNFVPIGPVAMPSQTPPAKLETLGRQTYGATATGFGYIHLRDVPDDLPAQLDKMLPSFASVRGLILDTRANGGGGCDHEAVFARFIPAGKKWRQYSGAGALPFAGPMVVIVDAGVRSAGETIAGMFKEDGRAWMIGDTPTAGMSAQKAVIKAPSGLFSVRFAVASNKGRFNDGRGIEGIGVTPHETTPYDPADLARGIDTQIRRAEEFLTLGLPKDRVPWEHIGKA